MAVCWLAGIAYSFSLPISFSSFVLFLSFFVLVLLCLFVLVLVLFLVVVVVVVIVVVIVVLLFFFFILFFLFLFFLFSYSCFFFIHSPCGPLSQMTSWIFFTHLLYQQWASAGRLSLHQSLVLSLHLLADGLPCNLFPIVVPNMTSSPVYCSSSQRCGQKVVSSSVWRYYLENHIVIGWRSIYQNLCTDDIVVTWQNCLICPLFGLYEIIIGLN